MTNTQLAPVPFLQFFDDDGEFLVGGLLFTYAAGTVTKLSTYTDSTGNVPNTNPVVLDARGEASVWLPPGTSYKLVLAPPTDTDPPTDAIWTQDNIEIPIVPDGVVIHGTSTTSMTIATGAQTFTTQAGMDLNAGMYVLVADQADVTNYFLGQITSYVGTTMTVNSTNTGGSGTFASWFIDLSGPPGPPSVATPRVPVLITGYQAAGSHTFTAPSDTAPSDVFLYYVTGGGGGSSGGSLQFGGGAGGTAIYSETGVSPGATRAVVVGAGALSTAQDGTNSTVTVPGPVIVTGGKGLRGQTSGFSRNGGVALNGNIANINGGEGVGFLAVNGGGSQFGQGGSSLYGSISNDGMGANTNASPGAGGNTQDLASDGAVFIYQYRGSGSGSQLSTMLTIASATTTDLGTKASNNLQVTGTTTINSFGSSASLAAPVFFLNFTGVLQLTYNGTSMILPTAANITTAAGDFAIAIYLGTGNWRVFAYYRASGQSLSGGGGGGGSSSNGGFVNKFINGTFDVSQRGTSSITSTVGGAYVLDGWWVKPTGASMTSSRTANTRTGALTQYGLRVNGASSVTDVKVQQRIEGSVSAPLNLATVTVQFQVFNNTGGSITPTLTVNYANAVDNWSASTVEANANGVSFQACANNAWTQIAYAFVVSGSIGNGMEVILDLGNNFGSGGNFAIVAESQISVTSGVTPGLNASPPAPELRPLITELAACQRYFTQTYGNGVAPGTATRAGFIPYADAVSASDTAIGERFPVQMRVAPTISYWDGAGNANAYSANGNGSWIDNLTPTTFPLAVGATGFSWYPGNVTYVGAAIHYAATAELYP